MRGASRDALDVAQHQLDDVVGGAPDGAMALAEGLLQVTRLLSAERSLGRALSDPVVDAEARDGLVDAVFGGKVAEAVLGLLHTVAQQRWSEPLDLVDALEDLGVSAALSVAEAAGQLDDVEDELFRFARIVAGSRELTRALADRATPAAAKSDLLRSLLTDKVSVVTLLLVEAVVVAPRGRPVDRALDSLAAAAAARHDSRIAVVTSAVALTADQSEQLAAAVGGVLGYAVRLQQRVDSDILGGVVVRVGDQLIDGSVAQRLRAARRLLTR